MPGKFVSIPDRYAKNKLHHLPPPAPALVSIPDRYAKNGVFEDILRVDTDEFQFLIGTLKTLACPKRREKIHQFQFLIGTLKTY